MEFCIVIPAHNEEAFLGQTLQSLVDQTVLPKKIVVVNDNSTDHTQDIIDSFTSKYSIIESVMQVSAEVHSPGSKVINAFNKGLETINETYDVICKFDADLIFPKDYLASIQALFQADSKCGMAGGFCYIKRNGDWVLESLTNKDHIRGALKAYRRECFQQIGGLKNTMGWDTVDELLAQYHGWKVSTDTSLHVKHLKPTGASYAKAAKFKQGEAFYRMRYGYLLTMIASAKLAWNKRSFSFYLNCLSGYWNAGRKNIPFIVSAEEGKFIRALRWKNIRHKLLFKNPKI
jgi:glycosyltransferase involved in cell wall biosynthesis